MRRLREQLALPDGQPLPFSATKNEGVRELWQLLQRECTGESKKPKKAKQADADAPVEEA